jgi:hypothetical protein
MLVKKFIPILFFLTMTLSANAQSFDMEILERATDRTTFPGDSIEKLTFATIKSHTLTVHQRDGALRETELIDIDKISFNTATGISELRRYPESGARTFLLHQNFPNPFNPATTIEYELFSPGWVEVQIFNLNGQKVRTLGSAYLRPGVYRLVWNGENDYQHIVPNGVYFAKMACDNSVQMKKLLFVK